MGHFRKVYQLYSDVIILTRKKFQKIPSGQEIIASGIYIYIFVEEVFWKFLMLQCPIGYWFDVYGLEYSSNYGMVEVPNLLG